VPLHDNDNNLSNIVVGAMDGMDNGVSLSFDSIQLLQRGRRGLKRAKKQPQQQDNDGSNSNGETLLLDGSIRGRACSGRVLAIWPCSSQYSSSPPLREDGAASMPTPPTRNPRRKKRMEEEKEMIMTNTLAAESQSARLLLEALTGNCIPADTSLELQGTRIVNGQYKVPGNATLPSTVLVGRAALDMQENWNPYLTLRETLEAYVQLVLSSTSQQKQPHMHHFSKQARDAHVDELLAQVGLTSRQDALVGILPSSSLSSSSRRFKNKNKQESNTQLQVPDQGISDLERRLLLLAVAMIGNPQVLLIQQDFFEIDNDNNIIDLYSTIPRLFEVLQSLATRHHKTIVTVLSPTMPSRLVDSFVFPRVHDLLLLSEGRMFYSGPIAELPTYFMQLGYKIPTSHHHHHHASPAISTSIENGAETTAAEKMFLLLGSSASTSSSRSSVKTANMAEHIKQCLSKRPRINRHGDDEETEQQAEQRVDLLAATASSSTVYNYNFVNKRSSVLATNGSPYVVSSSSSSSAVNNKTRNLWLQFRMHLHRSFQSLKRRRMDIVFQILQHVGFALLYSYGVPLVGNNQASIQDRMTILSKIAVRTASVAFVSGLRGIPRRNIARERKLVSSEIGQGMYSSPLPYCMARTVTDLSLSFLWNAVYGSVVYTQTGLDMAASVKPYKFLALLASHGMVCDAMGTALSTILLRRHLSDNALALLTVGGLFNAYFHLDGRRLLKDMNVVQDNNDSAASSMMSSSSLPLSADLWVPKFSPTKWGLESLLLNEFSGLQFESDGDMFDVDGLPQFEFDFENFDNICYTGEDVLERLRLSPDDSTNDVDGSLDLMVASSSPLGVSISSMMKSLTNVLFQKKPTTTATTAMKDILHRQCLVTAFCWTFSYVQFLASSPLSNKSARRFLSMERPQGAAGIDRDEPVQEQTGFRWF
jgi:ABC-type multidrug transport system ATPase subunit